LWRRGKEAALLVIFVVVFALSAAAMLYLTMHQPAVTVPKLVGKSATEAAQLAHQAGLQVKIKNRVHSDQIPANVVIEQWPRAGMTIKRGQSVRVNLSSGPHTVEQTKARQSTESQR
jgi:serine/threonine-protein kinase